MSVEWDEDLIEEGEQFFHDCNSVECQAKQQVYRIARAEHTARLEAEALVRADERRAVLGRVVEKLESESEVFGPTPWERFTSREAIAIAIAIIRAEMEGEG